MFGIHDDAYEELAAIREVLGMKPEAPRDIVLAAIRDGKQAVDAWRWLGNRSHLCGDGEVFEDHLTPLESVRKAMGVPRKVKR